MRWEYSASAGYSKEGPKKEHSIELSLDLSLADFLESRNVALELAKDEHKIRTDIYQLVIADLTPNLIRSSGQSAELPEGRLKTTTHSNMTSDWVITDPGLSDETAELHSRMSIELNIQADRPVTAMQALKANSAGLAAQVADDVIFSLKQKYLGITEHKTTSKLNLEDDRIVESYSQTQTDSPSN